MKVFKGKIWAAIGSLMDHAGTTSSTTKQQSSAASAAAVLPDRALLADIEAAIERCTGSSGGGGNNDDRHVHEILFLVSNAPGAITFLSRRITARLEAARAPAAALRSLLLVHRLLRAGDRPLSLSRAPRRRAPLQLLVLRGHQRSLPAPRLVVVRAAWHNTTTLSAETKMCMHISSSDKDSYILKEANKKHRSLESMLSALKNKES